jgi:hypothetical protein
VWASPLALVEIRDAKNTMALQSMARSPICSWASRPQVQMEEAAAQEAPISHETSWPASESVGPLQFLPALSSAAAADAETHGLLPHRSAISQQQLLLAQQPAYATCTSDRLICKSTAVRPADRKTGAS